MRLTLEQYGTRYTVEAEGDDCDAEQMRDLLRALLVAASWHPETAAEIVGDAQ